MKRILIFTGKGGVGKTSVAAAHALKSSQEGKKTLIVSTDMAHNLGDLFNVPIGKEEVAVANNLYALEIDPNYVMEKDFKNLMRAFSNMIGSINPEGGDMDEFIMMPGMDELFALLKIQELYDNSDYERIIVDCAPTGETLSLLKFPELMCWYMDKFFPIGKVAVRILSPVSKSLFKIQLPDRHAMSDIETLYVKLIELQELLKNKEVSSVRLVTIPEKMVVEETKRNYMYMKLYNYNVDGIFINRILPREIGNPFFEEWITIQKKYIAEIETCFDQIPKYYIPWYDTDLLGLDAINRICDDVFAKRTDLFEIKADIEGEKYEQTETGYDLKLFLPNITKDEVAVNLSGSDVIVKIGNYKRNIPMPNTLRGMEVTSATFDQSTLVIAFQSY
ncbi:MAG: arsenite/tail-anchored protein-transporting ATPase [Acetobacterium sp.]|jgi:arsenite-transporting ATPase|uniref:ArsA family ATPase n=1 Tax=Acetobacterium carbinolicum TaxID=52690 RepID=UPI0029E71117|nr:arsenite/tail-anchored protein-transporting ATPase [Acetobacterium sp.]